MMRMKTQISRRRAITVDIEPAPFRDRGLVPVCVDPTSFLKGDGIDIRVSCRSAVLKSGYGAMLVTRIRMLRRTSVFRILARLLLVVEVGFWLERIAVARSRLTR